MAERDPERDRKALELRKAGATPERIAEALNFTDADAAIASLQDSLAVPAYESATEAHRLELERLDAMQRALWPSAMQGQWQAVDRILAIMTRRARLLNLEGDREEQPEADGIDQLAERRTQRLAGMPRPANQPRP